MLLADRGYDADWIRELARLGAEADAAWAIDPTGQEAAYWCSIARLRDWLRFGLVLAHDGVWNGQQIVPRQRILDATTVPGNNHLRNTIAPSSDIKCGFCRVATNVSIARSAGPVRRSRIATVHGSNGSPYNRKPSTPNPPKPSPLGTRWWRNRASSSSTIWSRSTKFWSIRAPSIAKLPETPNIASDRSIHRSTSWPDGRNNHPRPVSVVPHVWIASNSLAPTVSIGYSKLLCLVQRQFAVSAPKPSILFWPFSQGTPLSSTCFSAKILSTPSLIKCSPEILVSHPPVAAM
jgi:hypothetical protein